MPKDRTLGNRRYWERGPKETVERSEGREELENIEEHKQVVCPVRETGKPGGHGTRLVRLTSTGGKANQGTTRGRGV